MNGMSLTCTKSSKTVIVLQTTIPMTLKAFFSGQAAWLNRQGFEVHVISSPGIELQEFAKSEGVHVHAVDMSRTINPFQDAVSCLRLYWLYRKIKPQIVHGFTPKAGLLGMLAARMAGIPHPIYAVLGMPEEGKGFRSRITFCLERLICGLAERVTTECESIQQVLLRHHLKPAEKIDVIPAWSWNTLARFLRAYPERARMRASMRAELNLPADAVVLGYVGRIVRDKGMSELNQAFRRLRSEFPRLRLVLIGDFEEAHPLAKTFKAELCEHPDVTVTKFISDVPAVMAGIDILLHPSYREGLPTVPLEANALGIPVVTTRIPGCVDAIVDGITGTLVASRDAGALTRAVRELLVNEEKRVAMGEAGHQRMEQAAAQEQLWEQLKAVYESLLPSCDEERKE